MQNDIMITLDETDRQNLILHLLNRTDVIDGYSKFYNLIYLLKRELAAFGILDDYKFNSYYLTIKDKTLENDLDALILQRLVDNDPVKIDSAHKHKIRINSNGKLHMKFFNVDKKLRNKLGNETLKKIDELLKKYNSLPIEKVMAISKEQQHPPITSS